MPFCMDSKLTIGVSNRLLPGLVHFAVSSSLGFNPIPIPVSPMGLAYRLLMLALHVMGCTCAVCIGEQICTLNLLQHASSPAVI